MFDDLINHNASQEHYDELLQVIAGRVTELLNDDPGLLFSYMYRLDIDEHKLKHVVQHYNGEARINALSELILKRQLLRIELRKKYSDHDDEKDEES
jgi:hypothetical protein